MSVFFTSLTMQVRDPALEEDQCAGDAGGTEVEVGEGTALIPRLTSEETA